MQIVFASLARNAAALARRRVLAGWLYRAAQFAAIDVVRAESRRRRRETEAQTMRAFTGPTDAGADWEKLRPAIDQIIGELEADDHDAEVLRFFGGKSFAELGARLGLTENAVRMRIDRALEKMRGALAHRGLTSTAAALGMALANQVGVAAPVGLAASVAGAAMTGTTVATGGWLAIFMSIGKLQVGIASALAVAGATGYMLQGKSNEDLRREIAALRGEQPAVVALRAENRRLAATAAEVEVLQRDDLELKRLEQRVTEIKQANIENARVAQVRSQNRRRELEDGLREKDRLAQAEVVRLNQEGNKLVEEFKELSKHAAEITGEERVLADAAVNAKMEAIQTKKRAIQAFAENTHREENEMLKELWRIAPNAANPLSIGDGALEQRKLEIRQQRERRAASGGVDSTNPPR